MAGSQHQNPDVMQICKPQIFVKAPNIPRKSCHLHHNHSPLRIVRASYQYMYDDTNSEYLDCVNSVSHVGHCHPAVVKALSVSMDFDVNTCGWAIDYGDLQYPKKLHQILPDHLDTILFCNSGSQLPGCHVDDFMLAEETFHTSNHTQPRISTHPYMLTGEKKGVMVEGADESVHSGVRQCKV